MGHRATLYALGVAFFAIGLNPWPAAAQVSDPLAMPTSGETIHPNQVVIFSLGGDAPEARVREYLLSLQRGASVIVDLIPVDPSTVAARNLPTAALANQSSPTQAAPAILEVSDPNGVVTKRTTIVQNSLFAILRPRSLETRVGDSGVRAAVYALEGGVYRIRARYEAAKAAKFELLVRPREVPPPPQRVPIQFGYDRELDLEPGKRTLFEFRSDKPNQWVVIDMQSDAFDPYIELHGPGGEEAAQLAYDDDGGGEKNARVLTQLPNANRYTVVARSSLRPEGGKYRLKLQLYKPPKLTPIPLAMGTIREGTFSGRNEGLLLGENSGAYHLYSVAGKAGQLITVVMKSEDEDEIDPMLQAGIEVNVTDAASPRQEDFAIIAENDDENEVEFNAKLQIQFNQDTTILIRAAALDELSPRGDYTISVTEDIVTSP